MTGLALRRLLGFRPLPGLDHASVSSFLACNPAVWLDLPGRPQQRREPGWILPWWWLCADRLIVAVGSGVVAATRPVQTSGGLSLESCAKVTFVGVNGPPPGAVQVAHDATLVLTPDHVHPVVGQRGPRPGHAHPDPTLAALVGHRVRLEAQGEARPGESCPVAEGVVAQAGVLEHHVVLCLDDGTLAVVHRPATVEMHDRTTVITGEFEQLVLDDPAERSIAVIRTGRLVVTPQVR